MPNESYIKEKRKYLRKQKIAKVIIIIISVMMCACYIVTLK